MRELLPEPRPDGRQSETARAVQRGVLRHLALAGFAAVPEFTLVTGRRADLLALGPKGDIAIVEIKSSVADFRADTKWPEYRAFCDRLLFAVPLGFPHEILPVETGLLVADAFGAEMLRAPPVHPLAAASRKALTLRFARMVATRLAVLHDPDLLNAAP